MKIQLSEHFTYGKLIKFTIPTIIMMIFTSIYGIVDGIFVSNCVGSDAFAAVKFNYTSTNDFRNFWIYDWNRWKCTSFKNYRRRK